MSAAKIIALHPQRDSVAPKDPTGLIEDYLDHLYAPLVGIVPLERRQRLRMEAQDDIEGRMESFLCDGIEPMEAATKALEVYGDTDKLSEHFIEEWVRYQPKGWLERQMGLPLSYAAFFFIQAYLWALLLMQYRMMTPASEGLKITIPLTEFRAHYWPEPLPLPETSASWGLLWLYALVAPFIAGWLTGSRAMVQAWKCTLSVQSWLVLLTFVAGAAMLPVTEGIFLALIQLVWWVPMGTLTAHVAGVLARRRRLRFQPPKRMKSNEK